MRPSSGASRPMVNGRGGTSFRRPDLWTVHLPADGMFADPRPQPVARARPDLRVSRQRCPHCESVRRVREAPGRVVIAPLPHPNIERRDVDADLVVGVGLAGELSRTRSPSSIRGSGSTRRGTWCHQPNLCCLVAPIGPTAAMNLPQDRWPTPRTSMPDSPARARFTKHPATNASQKRI